jgi:hypothetical protein
MATVEKKAEAMAGCVVCWHWRLVRRRARRSFLGRKEAMWAISSAGRARSAVVGVGLEEEAMGKGLCGCNVGVGVVKDGWLREEMGRLRDRMLRVDDKQDQKLGATYLSLYA